MPIRILLRIGAFSGHAVDGKNDLQSLERRKGGRIENGSVCGRSGDETVVMPSFFRIFSRSVPSNLLAPDLTSRSSPFGANAAKRSAAVA